MTSLTCLSQLYYNIPSFLFEEKGRDIFPIHVSCHFFCHLLQPPFSHHGEGGGGLLLFSYCLGGLLFFSITVNGELKFFLAFENPHYERSLTL